MNSGMGFYQSAGSSALPYVMAATARNGLIASDLAARGLDAPDLSFEGDKAMLSAYSDEPAAKIDAVLGALGEAPWRIMGQSYKTVPTETITHGPIECTLALRARAAGREPARIAFRRGPPSWSRSPMNAPAAGARLRPSWKRASICGTALPPPGYAVGSRSRKCSRTPRAMPPSPRCGLRIELIADAAQSSFEGATLRIDYADGSTDAIAIPAFRGTPGNPIDGRRTVSRV